MQKLTTKCGKSILIDAIDYSYLSKFTWYLCGGYAVRKELTGERYSSGKLKYKQFSMHREVLGLPSGRVPNVDHVNMNKLDNRRINLRLANETQNNANKAKPRNNTSGFKGVYYKKSVGRWFASIGYKNKCLHLGYFESKVEAAKAYNRAAVELFGPFAQINKIAIDNFLDV